MVALVSLYVAIGKLQLISPGEPTLRVEARVRGACRTNPKASRVFSWWKTEALVALTAGGRRLVLIGPALPPHYPANLHNAGPAVTQPACLNIVCVCVRACAHACVLLLQAKDGASVRKTELKGH